MNNKWWIGEASQGSVTVALLDNKGCNKVTALVQGSKGTGDTELQEIARLFGNAEANKLALDEARKLLHKVYHLAFMRGISGEDMNTQLYGEIAKLLNIE